MASNDVRNCPNCGAANRRNASFCNTCGATLALSQANSVQAAQPATSPATAPTTAFTPAAPAPKPRPPVESAARDKTVILSDLQADFSLLPVGAILQGNGAHFVVVEGRVEKTGARHVYLVERSGPSVRTCPRCGRVGGLEDETTCQRCGFDLNAVRPSAPRFTAVELGDGKLAQKERSLAERGVWGRGLLLAQGYFSQSYWPGEERHYLLYGARLAPYQPASQFPRPQLAGTVLSWGVDLASGLSALHRRRVAHGQVDLDHIVARQEQAWLTGFERALAFEDKAREEIALLQGRDIVGLASSLEVLLGGPNAKLPPALGHVVRRGLGQVSDQFFPSAQAFGEALQDLLDNLPPEDLKVRIGHHTDVGRLKENNEDNLAIGEKGVLSTKLPVSFGAYVVADGMGGQAAGEIASDLAAERAVAFIRQAARDLERVNDADMAAIVNEACLAANRVVYEEKSRQRNDMGTTLVAALRVGSRVALANVGDSRAYVINAQDIRQVTVDHSLVQRLIDTGQITPQEARTHPQRSLIYKALGDQPAIDPDTFNLRLQPGDRLLLCSDGLSGMVDDAVIWQTVLSFQDPQAACARLVELANQAGGEDNITALIVQAQA